MGPFLVVGTQVSTDASLGFRPIRISFQVHFFILDAPPQPLHEDIIHAPASAIHADLDARRSSTAMKAFLVNWLPWSALNSSGLPLLNASSPEELGRSGDVPRPGMTLAVFLITQ